MIVIELLNPIDKLSGINVSFSKFGNNQSVQDDC